MSQQQNSNRIIGKLIGFRQFSVTMPIPTLNNFFGCGQLSSGGLIVGYSQICCYILIGVFIILHPYQLFIACASLFGLVASLLVILGTKKRNQYWLLPYLICEPLFINGVVLFALVSISCDSFADLIWLLAYYLIIFLRVYSWMIVYSLFAEIKNGPGPGRCTIRDLPTYRNKIVSILPMADQKCSQQAINLVDSGYEQPLIFPETDYLVMTELSVHVELPPTNNLSNNKCVSINLPDHVYEEIK